ncbi:hypothetical protein DIPPA_07607 [Diplonema papillatum]|nr:hypothetical protein DIPPA_07607 [Diplonema papillatum]
MKVTVPLPCVVALICLTAVICLSSVLLLFSSVQCNDAVECLRDSIDTGVLDCFMSDQNYLLLSTSMSLRFTIRAVKATLERQLATAVFESDAFEGIARSAVPIVGEYDWLRPVARDLYIGVTAHWKYKSSLSVGFIYINDSGYAVSFNSGACAAVLLQENRSDTADCGLESGWQTGETRPSTLTTRTSPGATASRRVGLWDEEKLWPSVGAVSTFVGYSCIKIAYLPDGTVRNWGTGVHLKVVAAVLQLLSDKAMAESKLTLTLFTTIARSWMAERLFAMGDPDWAKYDQTGLLTDVDYRL